MAGASHFRWSSARAASLDTVNEKLRVNLHGAPETMLATLYARAVDADAEKPILGDTFAKDIVSRIDYDWRKTGLSAGRAPSLTIRTAHFDNWARQFLATHEPADVIQPARSDQTSLGWSRRAGLRVVAGGLVGSWRL